MPDNLYTGPKLRDWQWTALNQWDNYNKGIVQAVPGAGKTFLAIKAFCRKLDKFSDLRVLIVCPRLTLIKQWETAILENTNLSKEDIYEISSKTEVQAFKKVQNTLHKHKVFISTFNQIKQFFEQKDWKDYNWFLIVDEMHNTSDNYKFPDDKIPYKLGLSATPKKKGKTSDFNLGGIVFTYAFAEALRDKIILEPEFKLILYSVNKEIFKKIVQAERMDHQKTLDLVDSSYDSFLHDEKKDNEQEDLDFFTSKNVDFIGIQKILKEKFGIGTKNPQQSLVFVNRIKKADLLDSMLSEKFGKNISHSYHSQCDEYTCKGYFERIRREFEQKIFNVLISVSTLGEGIDFPYASNGILASPIYNPTAFVQKVGRLLRKYKNHEKAVIYYYAPSELVSRLLTDPKIEPNYFKSVLKIADEHKKLYFVNRKTLKEEKGSLADLLSQGSAYARNEDVKLLKVPPKLDSILRFSKRIYPKSFIHWRKYCEENDFSQLEEKVLDSKRSLSKASENIAENLSKVLELQKYFLSLKPRNKPELFVEEALRKNIITKVKYGTEINAYLHGKKTKIATPERELYIHSIKTEFSGFLNSSKKLEKELNIINNSMPFLDSKKKEDVFEALFKISKAFFALQSLFLDQLDLSTVAKTPVGEKFVLTLGQDIFLAGQIDKLYAYPEDFGYSRWKTLHPKEPPKEDSPLEKFFKSLMDEDISKVLSEKEWEEIKKRVEEKTSISFSNKEIKKELEEGKISGKYSLEKTFFLLETLKAFEK